MPDPIPHVFDMTPDQLAEHLAPLGMPAFRAKQVLEWVYRKQAADPQQMTNLSKRDRDALAEHLRFQRGRVLQHQLASDGTSKLLVDWSLAAEDEPSAGSSRGAALPVLGNPAAQTECVMIPATSQESGKARRTACVSSQIGCPVGCRFCASGLGGLDGNLTAGQIVQQAWMLGRPTPLQPQASPVTNIVFMGMGEPLANFDAVTRAAQIMMADWGLALSGRRITISTVGLPAQIRRLAELELPVTLAISLHAPNDEIRRSIIPWAEFVSIPQLIEAGQYYFQKTGREITLEYILLSRVNDQPEHASELASVAKRLRSNVNIIRYNEVADLPYQRPRDEDVRRFQQILRERGVNVHIRASRGRDIAAACGQLRHEAAQP